MLGSRGTLEHRPQWDDLGALSSSVTQKLLALSDLSTCSSLGLLGNKLTWQLGYQMPQELRGAVGEEAELSQLWKEL